MALLKSFLLIVKLSETRADANAGILYYTGNAKNQDTEGSEEPSDKCGLHSWQELHSSIVFSPRLAALPQQDRGSEY